MKRQGMAWQVKETKGMAHQGKAWHDMTMQGMA
jgi:hypothetical protein